jgi:hypothetical protein
MTVHTPAVPGLRRTENPIFGFDAGGDGAAHPATTGANRRCVRSAAGRGPAGLSTPTGTVTFADGGTPIGTVNVLPNGLARLSHVYTSGGTHSITAAYNGNDIYQGSISTPLIQTVRQRVSVTTTPTGAVAGTPRTAGTSEFTVSVRDTAVPSETATAPLTTTIDR